MLCAAARCRATCPAIPQPGQGHNGAVTDLLVPRAKLEKLWTGAIWSEGPVWIRERSAVRWSDIPNNRILEWRAETGEVGVYAEPAEYTNGRTLDHSGTVLQCSHGHRRIERDTGAALEGLCERWSGGRFNSPNDIVVAADGAIWFTDPPYGIAPSGREGHPAEPEYGGCFVFRFDERSGEIEPVITDMVHPNGLAFSPDESLLYVSDTAHLQIEGAPQGIRAYPVTGGRVNKPGRDFVTVTPGAADGFRVDTAGRIWTSSGDSVQIFSPEGALLHKVAVPEPVANLCFGGQDGTELFITASTSLYRIRTTTRDAAAR